MLLSGVGLRGVVSSQWCRPTWCCLFVVQWGLEMIHHRWRCSLWNLAVHRSSSMSLTWTRFHRFGYPLRTASRHPLACRATVALDPSLQVVDMFDPSLWFLVLIRWCSPNQWMLIPVWLSSLYTCSAPPVTTCTAVNYIMYATWVHVED